MHSRPPATAGIHWVRGEIEESLTRARTLIDRVAEEAADNAQLEQAFVELHQVQGTASMIQCYGLAAAAQEMAAALKDLLRGDVLDRESVFAALLGTAIQLSDYVQALADGMPDSALMLQPAINELRLARGQPVLTESELFVTQMQSLAVPLPAPESQRTRQGAAQEQAQRLLPVLQASLLAWIRGGADAQTGAARIGKIAEVIAQNAATDPVHGLWRIAAAAMEAYLARGIPNALELKRLCGRLGAQLKQLSVEGETRAADQAGELAMQLLFLVGRSTAEGPRASQLREHFALADVMPDGQELDRRRRSIHGTSTVLLAKVSDEIRTDFGQVKDAIDLIVRTGHGDTSGIVDALRRIAATLGALGLSRLQQAVEQQQHMLEDADLTGSDPSRGIALATSILRVENDLEEALFRQMQRRGGAADEVSDSMPASRDLAEGRAALYREFMVNLARVKSAVDAYLKGSSVDLPDAALQVDEIASGFEVLGQPDAAERCRRLRRFVSSAAFSCVRDVPGCADTFADVIAAVEYYIEAVRTQLPTAPAILEDLAHALDVLELAASTPVEPSASAEPEAEAEAGVEAGEPGEAVVDRGAESAVESPPAELPPVAADESFDAGEDPEIREIFLEEADEVLAALKASFAKWNRDPQDHDALTTLRRAFHTLKGSGRTVGATEIGEFGWTLENLLNRCLDGSVAIGPGIVETAGRAVEALPGLIDAFRSRAAQPDAIGQILDDARAWAEGRAPSVAEEPDLTTVFRDDAGEKLAEIAEWLAAHADRPAVEVGRDVVRAFHTLRGSARVVGADAVSEVAAALELFLESLGDAAVRLDREAMILLGEAAEALRGWVSAFGDAGAGQDGDQADAGPWLERIEAEQQRLTGGSGAEAAAQREMVEIFSGEAFDLVAEMETQLRGWTQAPDNRRAASGLKVLAHTLKGAAQVSVCAAIAKVATALNRAFEGAETRGLVPEPTDLDCLLGICESLYQLLDRYRDENGRIDDDGSEIAASVDALGWSAAGDSAAAEAPVPAPDADGSTPSVAPPDLSDIELPSFESAGQDTGTAPPPAPEPAEPPPGAREAAAPSAGPDRPDLGTVPPLELPELSDIELPPIEPLEPIELDGPATESADERAETETTAVQSPEPIAEVEPAAVPDVAQPEASGAEPDPELLAIFQAEAEELLESLDRSIDAFEQNPAGGALDEIMRVLHTLKGSARVSGLDGLGDVVHHFESGFEQIAAGERAVDASLMVHVRHVLEGLHMAVDDLKRGLIPDTSALLDEALLPPATVAIPGAPTEQPASDAAVDSESAGPAPEFGTAPGSTAPVPPPAVAAPLPEDFDVELAQTFAGEAGELMEILEEALPRWQALPGDYSPARDMLRALHTYKGGARMAGMRALGESAHETESLIEGLEYAGELDGGALEVVAAAVADLRRQTDRLERGEYGPLIEAPAEEEAEFYEPVPAPSAPAAPPAAVEPKSPEAGPIEAGPAQGGESEPKVEPEPEADTVDTALMWDPQLFWQSPEESESQAGHRRETARVSVDVLEKMLNEAGEVAIYRSRLDEQHAAIEAQLDDLGQAIARVRDQLRQLDTETDAQIAARGLTQSGGDEDRYAGEFDPLEMDRYTRMQELSRSLAESVGDLAAVHGSLDQLVSEDATILLQQGRVTTEVQQGLMRTLMVPFSRQVARLQRVVQQTAGEEHKQVEIAFDGIEAELDRNVLERMTAPLEHLLRNAVIHGIETADERTAAGKAPTGRLQLRLWREGSQLFIELQDDGRGLDLKAIRETAVRRGLMLADAEVGDDEAAQFIFMPGFSTARHLTQAAGRGVGMDVVAAEVKQLGGALDLATEPGKGTRFKVRLPLSLALAQSLLVGVGHELYAVSLPSIEGIARLPVESLDTMLASDGPDLEYGGHEYRVTYLGDMVGVKRELPPDLRMVHAILVRLPEGIAGAERRVAVVVDQMLGSRQIVSKAVGAQVSSIAGIAGASILADGRVVPILDIAALVQDQTRRHLRDQVEQRSAGAVPVAEPRRETVMVVDDSITIRRVTERLLTRHGYLVTSAKDGLDAMAQLQTDRPDAILLDIEMPRADGFEVAAFIRNSESIAKTPIIMITSRSSEKHRDRARQIGVDRYLIKPFQEDQLIMELQTLLKERAA